MPTPESYYETAEQWLEPAVSELGITSADKYYSWLRESGLYVPRAIVRETWRTHWTAKGYSEVISRYDEESLIPRSWITERPSTSQEPYVSRFRVTGFDRLANEAFESALYVPMSRRPTRAALVSRLLEIIRKYKPTWEVNIEDIELEAVYHVEGKPW